MPSPTLTDEQLAKKYGQRTPGGQPLFKPKDRIMARR